MQLFFIICECLAKAECERACVWTSYGIIYDCIGDFALCY